MSTTAKPGGWVARWRGASGRDRSKAFDRRTDAQQYGVAAEAEARRNPHRPEDRDQLTIDRWLDVWLDDIVAQRCAAGQVAATTGSGYEQKVPHPHPPPGRPPPPRRALPGPVEELMTEIIASGPSPTTARGVRAVLSKCLTDAVRRQLLDSNPAKAAAPPPVEKLEPSSFTPDEFQKVMAELRGTYGRLIRFVVLTGLRTSEALALRWADVDLEADGYQVVETVHQISEAAGRVVPETGEVIGRGKTDASRRPTRLSTAAGDVLRGQRTAQAHVTA